MNILFFLSGLIIGAILSIFLMAKYYLKKAKEMEAAKFHNALIRKQMTKAFKKKRKQARHAKKFEK